MGATLDGVLNQFRDRGMPEIDQHKLTADNKKHVYGPKKKAWFRLNEYVSPKTGKIWINGYFGYKDEHWQIEHDPSGTGLSPEEAAEMRAQATQREREYQERMQQQYAIAAERAGNQWRRARRDGHSPYLARKQVARAESVRYMTDASFEDWLIIPLIRYDEGRLVGVQKVAPVPQPDESDKKYTTGFEKIGAACRLGDEPLDGDLIVIAEGYATAASGREAIDYQHPVYMALDSGNLPHVAKILRAKYPASPILFLADDDYLPKKNGDENHTGHKKAEQAQQHVGNALVLLPTFSVARHASNDDESLPKLTDFNDLHCAEGIEACRAQIALGIQQLVSPAPSQADDVGAPTPAATDKTPGGAGGDAVAEAVERELYEHFALIEGKTRVIDLRSQTEYTLPALRSRFGKKPVETWLDRIDKRMLTQAEVSTMKRIKEELTRKTDTELVPLMKRYIYLDGSSNIWDAKLREVISSGAAKLAMGSYYDVWVDSPERRVIPLANVRFAPGMDLPEEHYINLYTGMDMVPAWPDDPQRLPRSLWELMGLFPKCANMIALAYHLCDGRNEVFEWLINWIAYPLQHVGAKMDTAILMHGSVHGSGKSMFWEKCVKPLYGRYAITLSQDQLETQYTGSRSGRLFMLFEEVVSSKQRYSMTGKIKHMITGLTQVIEKKFMNAWEEENHGNCVFLSNAIQPLHIESYDRRFQVIWPIETADDDMYREVDREVAEDGLEQFLAFLLALPLTLTVEQCPESVGLGERCGAGCKVCQGKGYVPRAEPVRFDNHTKPLMTEEKARVIRYGLSGWELFVYQWERGELDGVPFVSCITDDLYAVYCTWCEAKRETPISENKFSICVSTYDMKRLHKKRAWWRWPNKSSTQSMVFKVGNMPREAIEQDWLGKQIGQFQVGARNYGAKLRGDP